MSQLSRTMDDINLAEVEEMARGSGPRPPSDRQLHLNMLRKKIQQQRSMVTKLSRDDLENQHLHLLEELEILKKDSNTKDLYIKRLSTKILRLQKSENLFHDEGNKTLNGSLRLEMEQKIRSLENQLKTAKVYGTSLAGRRGSRTPEPSMPASNKGQIDILRNQIQALEVQLKEEQEHHAQNVTELQNEIQQLKQKSANDNARSVMLDNMEVTRLTRELSKSSQELQLLRSDYNEIKPKFEELQINKIILTRENERLKWEVERHVQNVDSVERQLREAREKSLQGIQDQERIARMENELTRLRRLETAPSSNRAENSQNAPRNKVTEDVLQEQIKNLESELDKEYKESQALRKRLTDREQEMEKLLKDITELRSAHVLLTKECENLRNRVHDAIEPLKDTDGWFKIPPNLRKEEFGHALRLYDSFQSRRDAGTATEPFTERISNVPDKQLATDEVDLMKGDLDRLNRELRVTKEELRKARDIFSAENMQNQRAYNDVQVDIDRSRTEIASLKQNLEESHRELSKKSKLVEELQRQLRDIAEGSMVYNLEEDLVDQSRLSADNIVLQHGDNLLQLHFGPFAFNQEFFAQADALRISRWRLKWSVFGEDMFAQDSEQLRPDFDFTAVHCITMDERIMKDIAEGFIRIELVGIRNDFSRAFAFATFSCRKFLTESNLKLNRIRGEVPLVSQFNIGKDFGIMVYWMRLKFDVQETQALFKARQKALSYVESKANGLPDPDQLWLQEQSSLANLLHIEVNNCRSVKASTGSSPPNPCVLYQFYNGKTTYTPTIISSENPRFEHRATFRVTEDEDLRHYLMHKKLDFYVTDTKDYNDDHFLGYCQISLSELTEHPILDRELQLFAQNEHPNGTITVSLYWERPYGKHQDSNGYSAAHVPNLSARVNRVSLTPRGSLVSVTHNAKLLKVDKPNEPHTTSPSRHPTIDKSGMPAQKTEEPHPIPRKSIRIDMQANAAMQADSRKGNDYFSPPSSSNHRTVNHISSGFEQTRGHIVENGNGHADKAKNESGRSQRGNSVDSISEPPTNRNGGSARKTSSNNPIPQRRDNHSEESRTALPHSDVTQKSKDEINRNNASQPTSARNLEAPRRPPRRIRDTPRSEGALSSRGNIIGSPTEGSGDATALMSPDHVQTVRAELHSVPNGDLTRKPSNASNVRQAQMGTSPRNIPEDSVVIIVHSLYFIPGASVLSDDRPGEVFVVIQFLSVEYESPLAVIKPNLPNKDLTFEFQKVFPMNSKTHSEERRLVFDMLNSSPSGRIQFSVYLQLDDEDSDSELIGVAALSLNRLLIKEQDAIEAELKLINPADRVTVGYAKVTVHAVQVLLDIRQEYRQSV